jgi:hypothetical protein
MEPEKRRMLEGGVHFDVQPGNGTRYDLIAMLDPYGGVLIAWSITGWLYRYYESYTSTSMFEDVGTQHHPSEIKQLGRHGCRNEHDLAAIKQIMDNWFNGVKQ